MVEELTGLDGGAMSHVALSPQLEASTGLHGVEGFLADTRIASRTPARTVKIYIICVIVLVLRLVAGLLLPVCVISLVFLFLS
jgi:hypothetical protein